MPAKHEAVRKSTLLLLLLAGLSVLSGYLLSRASWVGRTGISLFYKQYRFLKVWWQGALAVFAVWLLLYLLHRTVEKRADRPAKIFHVFAVAVALIGFWLTYSDFRNDVSHRLLGERFHLGAYLFWAGWIIIALFFLSIRKPVLPQP